MRMLLAVHKRAEDLIRIGAYQKGTDQILDKAISALPAITGFLQQGPQETAPLANTIDRLLALPS